MNKEEFLKELRVSLQGEVSQAVINENIEYYSNYIDGELRKGNSLESVMNELGSPRLIAHTIIDTQGDGNTAYGGAGYSDDTMDNGFNEYGKKRVTWFDKLFRILIFMAIIIIAGFVLKLLLPFIIVGIVISIFISLMKR